MPPPAARAKARTHIWSVVAVWLNCRAERVACTGSVRLRTIVGQVGMRRPIATAISPLMRPAAICGDRSPNNAASSTTKMLVQNEPPIRSTTLSPHPTSSRYHARAATCRTGVVAGLKLRLRCADASVASQASTERSNLREEVSEQPGGAAPRSMFAQSASSTQTPRLRDHHQRRRRRCRLRLTAGSGRAGTSCRGG